jgi:hypothetical protein
MSNSRHYIFEKSRSGKMVPAICLADGSKMPLHSMIDPEKEAQRLISTIGEIGFVVFLGLGGGFAPKAALEHTNAQVIVIDYDKEGIDELLNKKDYSYLLNNNRFRLLADLSDGEIKKFILENFSPALYNGIRTIPLRTRIEQDKEKFENAIAAIQEAIEIVSNDYSVQAHFGKRWFSNIIRNLKKIDSCDSGFLKNKTVCEAAIAAAGPSLDQQLPLLKELKSRNCFIICTDTAFAVLSHNGIEPDIVVSMDCQYISYYHFMGNNTHNIPLFMDIASPPLLCSFTSLPVFYLSGHPLAHYISENWHNAVCIDTSGGNVTYACLSLAEYLGAQHITLFGADFSYVKSQTYARGTYIYPFFSKRQNRLSPLESQLSTFLYRAPFLPAESGNKESYQETSILRFYRKKLEEKASAMNVHIESAKGQGVPLNLCKKDRLEKKEHKTENKKSHFSAIEFLKKYRDDILSLPPANDNENYILKLNTKERQIFTTLLPCMAAIKKRDAELKQSELVNKTKYLCAGEIEKLLAV